MSCNVSGSAKKMEKGLEGGRESFGCGKLSGLKSIAAMIDGSKG
jgi:hypothetical protein